MSHRLVSALVLFAALVFVSGCDVLERVAGSLPPSFSAPTFTNEQEVSVVGAPMWLFAVDDGSGDIVLSAERNNAIIIGRTSFASTSTSVAWQTVTSTADTGGVGIADHWHIFAHGYHWIVFSVTSAHTAYLLQLDEDFNRVRLEKLVDTDARQSTNDMFLVSNGDGVAAGFFLPGIGHRVYRIGTDGAVTETVEIGGGAYAHSNGASGIAIDNGVAVFAPEQMNMVAQGRLFLLSYDDEWEMTDALTLIDEDRTNIAMASGVRLADGRLVVHARVRDDAYPRGVLPPPPANPDVFTDDGGSIIRYVFAPDGTLLGKETLEEGTKAHRPHTALFGDTLVTTWDTQGGSVMRVDTISD